MSNISNVRRTCLFSINEIFYEQLKKRPNTPMVIGILAFDTIIDVGAKSL